MDFRSLNLITTEEIVVLPRAVELFDQLCNNDIFSMLDLKNSYYQIKLDEQSKGKTSFSTRKGTFKWEVLVFGLRDGTSCFSKILAMA